MVTSEPVRDRIVAFTRSMSAATSWTSPSIDASDGLSKGTITATLVSCADLPNWRILILSIERPGQRGKGMKQQQVVRHAGIKEKKGCGNWFGPTTSCWFRRLAPCLMAPIFI